ncbi:hypothetical protein GGF46_003963 [Coemansia sp. RSA 552]|nr:hypothetical protein GGF46_003963 [Coemansia sp. RSA 552]
MAPVHSPLPHANPAPEAAAYRFGGRADQGVGSDSSSSNGTALPNLYPSTLLPSRQIQAHHHPYHHQPPQQPAQAGQPVKLLQSCDSCRRRKIRCSGEKPVCSSCIRYQENCHYSPLATPRRRAGKLPRVVSAANARDGMRIYGGSSYSAQRDSSNEPLVGGADRDTQGPALADTLPVASSGGAVAEQCPEGEVGSMRRDIGDLSRRFDELGGKLDMLLAAVGQGQRRRGNNSGGSDVSGMDCGGSGSEADNSGQMQPSSTRSVSESGEFMNLADETSRFGLDATNQAALLEQLETPTMRAHLLSTFYQNADVNTIAFIPRHIFLRLQRERRAPTSMVNVMLADACNYSMDATVWTLGRAAACGHFIERAYAGLFECLEYDSTEHCVALLLFAMVISKAGLHRAWIMHSLSTQMAIRLRFNTLDSPLSKLAFRGHSELALEWKRRIFWQLYTFDVLTSTLSDLPPCLSIHDVRCNAPRPLSDTLVAGASSELAVLGPAVVFCDDQPTVDLQIEIMGIMCDISAWQAKLTPEQALFPPGFNELYGRIEGWQQRMPYFAVLAEGDLVRISEELKTRPGLIFLGLLSQYTRILLCMIKDTWLPVHRQISGDEEKTLEWARGIAYESALAVHRLVPFVRAMRLSHVCPFTTCVVYQACVVSLHACAWRQGPRQIFNAVDYVQRGLDFLEHVSPRWGFSGVLVTSLRSLIVERGFVPKGGQPDNTRGGHQAQEEGAGAEILPDSDAAEPPAQLSDKMMRPFLEESRWERILRTGEMPGLGPRAGPAEPATPPQDPSLLGDPLLAGLVHDVLERCGDDHTHPRPPAGSSDQ